jgi:hypothetical protein
MMERNVPTPLFDSLRALLGLPRQPDHASPAKPREPQDDGGAAIIDPLVMTAGHDACDGDGGDAGCGGGCGGCGS